MVGPAITGCTACMRYLRGQVLVQFRQLKPVRLEFGFDCGELPLKIAAVGDRSRASGAIALHSSGEVGL